MAKVVRYDDMTKPELVKALRAAHKRIAKLEAVSRGLAEQLLGAEQFIGKVTVTKAIAGPDTVSELVPPAFPWETE